MRCPDCGESDVVTYWPEARQRMLMRMMRRNEILRSQVVEAEPAGIDVDNIHDYVWEGDE
jgi:hypothetical protein